MTIKTYVNAVNPSKTPQTEPIPGTVPNSAGGFSFPVDCWSRLDRFIILGSSSPTYYANERKLTQENAAALIECIGLDYRRTIDRIVTISESGRAPKNDEAIFALAMCASNANLDCRKYAMDKLPLVCRIGTHLFQFIEAIEGLGRGWGRGLRNGINRWYTEKSPSDLAYQLIKYQSRDGWSHRDVMRLSHLNSIWHPNSENKSGRLLYEWVRNGWDWVGEQEHPNSDLKMVWAFERAKRATTAKEIVGLIQQYHLPRECIPTQFLTDADVWAALLEKMPMTAMIRNLATMTRCGLLSPLSKATKSVCDRLNNVDYLQKARIHPFAILTALLTYKSGRGLKGNSTWTPVQQVVTALDQGFYKAFKNVEPTNKRWLLALDVSGSMGWSTIGGVPGLTPMMAEAALSLVTASVESQVHIMGFSHTLVPLNIQPGMRVEQAIANIQRVPMGGTDCSLPMKWALTNRVEADAFVVYTDSQSWAGDRHAVQALREYRQKMGIPAKLIVNAMVSNGFSIADPNDGGMLDVVGCDSAAPQFMADFVRG